MARDFYTTIYKALTGKNPATTAASRQSEIERQMAGTSKAGPVAYGGKKPITAQTPKKRK